MSNSLLVGGIIELLGGQVPSTNPMCPDAVFMLAPGFDLGSAQPTQDFVASLILDGERPYGYRSSNRTITLPIVIQAPDEYTVAAARELIMQTVDAQQFDLIWTRDGGLPFVLKCFRALPTVVTYLTRLQAAPNYTCQLALSFPALPFGQADTPQIVPFSSPASVGTGTPSAPVTPVTLDDFSSVSLSGFTRSTRCIIGPFTAFWHSAGGAPVYHANVKSGPVSIVGQTAVTLWVGLGAPTWLSWAHWHFGPVSVAITLFDSSGNPLILGTAKKLTSSNNENVPNFENVSAVIPQTSSVFDYSSVASYSITVYNYNGSPFGGALCTPSIYLDNFQAIPVTVAAPPVNIRGWLYDLVGIGTARAPISINVQQPIISAPTTVTLTGTGNFIPPAGVTSLAVICVGAGGPGASLLTTGQGGGGSGGELASEPSITISGSAPIPYACGVGGTATGTGTTTIPFQTVGYAEWTCPQGVFTITVSVWGAGAGGAFEGPGGGGGEFAGSTTYTVVPGTTYQLFVGQGGQGSFGNGAGTGGLSWFFASSGTGSIVAHGGKAGFDGGSSGPAGGTGSGAPIHFNGGAGGASSGTSGGGGGGSAGASGAGGDGSGSSGGSAGSGGGAAGGAGGSTFGSGHNGSTPGAGGGGSGAYSSSGGGNGANGEVTISFTTGGSAPTNGGDTTFGPATAPLVLANGGNAAATGSATGATGTTGTSTNTIHFTSGSGANGTSGNAGGGGSSGGLTSAGNNASTSTGGAAPTNGGKGANGPTSQAPGNAGLAPGGGGSGALSTGTAETGGAGGNGTILVTYTATLAPFSNFIAHRPGPLAPASLQPWVSTASTSDPPDGRQYAVTSLVPGVNARFNGTYSMVAVSYNWDSPSVQRLVTITVYEYQYVGGPVTSSSCSRLITPDTTDSSVGGICQIGNLSLPFHDIAGDNSTAYYEVGITSANASDRFSDILFLDTTGQTFIVDTGDTEYVNFYLDEPDSSRAIGRILGSAFDRTEAISVSDMLYSMSGGPITINPGDNKIFLFSTAGAPAAVVSYFDRYRVDRV